MKIGVDELRVRDVTGIGILIGAIVGLIGFGFIPTATNEQQATAYTYAWYIVVATTLLPLWGYLQDKQPITGPWGGFINGLGTGLGVFLLVIGHVL
jgi:hypothetical protein